MPATAHLQNPVDKDLHFPLYGHNQHKTINRFIKVAVGFGANNAAVAF